MENVLYPSGICTTSRIVTYSSLQSNNLHSPWCSYWIHVDHSDSVWIHMNSEYHATNLENFHASPCGSIWSPCRIWLKCTDLCIAPIFRAIPSHSVQSPHHSVQSPSHYVWTQSSFCGSGQLVNCYCQI